MQQEFDLLISAAIAQGRVEPDSRPALQSWFADAFARMALYQPESHEPQAFERTKLSDGLANMP